MRLIALAGVLSGLEFALPYLEAFVPVPHGLFAAVGSLVTGAALVARVVAQKEMADG